ncbi:MAG: nucleotide exchange factor GrpE [Deltaproteobacteria bacterium]|nr:nucleotide exchange factor GrpE [Deltaproteobacteria bacterium]
MEKKGERGETSAEHTEQEKKDKKKRSNEEIITELEAALQKAQEEAQENYDRFLRTSADLENYKKRVAKEKADLIRYGNDELIRELLPVIDNLERALSHADAEGNEEGIRSGLEMTLQQFFGVLQRFGCTPICAEGECFDPNRHEAIMEQATGECDPGHVVSELEKGYLLNDRLVRPAKVVVAKAHVDTEENPESETE